MTRSEMGASASASQRSMTCKLSRRPVQVAWVAIALPPAASTANPIAVTMNTRVAIGACQVGRRAATQATARAIPSSARMYACGASPTAEWMNVPSGTWTADTSAENASRMPA